MPNPLASLAFLITPTGAITAHFVKDESALDTLIGCKRMTRGVSCSDCRRLVGVTNHELVTHCIWFSDTDFISGKDSPKNQIASDLLDRTVHGPAAVMALDVANSVCSIDPKFIERMLRETASTV